MSPNQTTKQIRHYILAPVSAMAHVKRNRSEQPLRSSDTPRLVCDLILDEVPLILVDVIEQFVTNSKIICKLLVAI
jgi:vacuolar protein sorting-associated protein 13D